MNTKAYRIFQSRVIEQYESMIEEEGFTVIDGTQDIEKLAGECKRKDARTNSKATTVSRGVRSEMRSKTRTQAYIQRRKAI